MAERPGLMVDLGLFPPKLLFFVPLLKPEKIPKEALLLVAGSC